MCNVAVCEEMRIVARRLNPLGVPFVFVGGAVMCLLVDDPESTQIRGKSLCFLGIEIKHSALVMLKVLEIAFCYIPRLPTAQPMIISLRKQQPTLAKPNKRNFPKRLIGWRGRGMCSSTAFCGGVGTQKHCG